MDNREAIEFLKIERDHMTPTLFTERIEAMDMAISALQEQDVPDTNVGKMDGDELDEAIRHCDEIVQDITWFCNSPSKYIEQRRHESAVKLRQLTSWLRELKRLRTEVYFLKAEKENEPVDLLGDVPCKTCKWRVTTTEKCEECIDGVSDNYEVQEPCEDCVSRQAAIDAALSAFSRGLLASPDIRKLPSVQPQYTELTPEEAASEIASGSIMSASYWLDAMIRLKQMGYAICRKIGEINRMSDRKEKQWRRKTPMIQQLDSI